MNEMNWMNDMGSRLTLYTIDFRVITPLATVVMCSVSRENLRFTASWRFLKITLNNF